MREFFTIIALLFLGDFMLLSQENDIQKSLLKEAERNKRSLSADPEKAFQENLRIISEARLINAKDAELRAIANLCDYHNYYNDFEKMIVTAKELSQKAGSYEIPVFQSIAKVYLFNAYTFTGLYDQALQELKKGEENLNKIATNDSLTSVTWASLYNSYSNYYSLYQDHENRLKYLKLTVLEYQKNHIYFERKFQYIGYANLAAAHMDMLNVDSSKYYLNLAIPKNEELSDQILDFVNLSTLGRINLQEKNYQKAIYYFKKAEKVEGYKNHLNVNMVYDKIIEAYQKLNDKENAKLYESKRDSLRLSVSENQIKSLHNLLQEKEKSPNYWYLYAITLVIISALFLFLFIRKNKILAKQERISQEYLAQERVKPNEKDYSKLLQALKENNPAFMFYFNEIFPDFTSKLLSVNSKLTTYEIEFCALLKMKLFTKDIAKYKFIAPKTVLNKKYILKNKLKIPENVDIYEWFDEL